MAYVEETSLDSRHRESGRTGDSAASAGKEERGAEDSRLLTRYHEDGDVRAREEIVMRFMPLARQLASRYRHAGEPQEDLVQVACLGLLKAVDRFEPERGAFTKYAVPTMLGELKRHFRDKGWAIHVPRATQELTLKVTEALGTLPAKLGRSPRPRDVAEAIGAPVEDVLEAMEAATAYGATSLDAPRPGSDGEDAGWSYVDSISTEERGYELVEIGEAMHGTVEALPERERVILKLRFEQDLTQAEIAERVGVSQMHVSRLLRRSLDKLAATHAEAA
jgi:RNA polymerase sigma-B factor